MMAILLKFRYMLMLLLPYFYFISLRPFRTAHHQILIIYKKRNTKTASENGGPKKLVPSKKYQDMDILKCDAPICPDVYCPDVYCPDVFCSADRCLGRRCPASMLVRFPCSSRLLRSLLLCSWRRTTHPLKLRQVAA